jgi:hypothetical protein
MRIFWLCQLVEFPRVNFWEPEIQQVSRANGNFPSAWSSTDAVRSFKYAVGVSECTTAQLAAVQADSGINVFDESILFDTFGSLNGAVRNKINSFLDQTGISRPNQNEVLHDLWTRISAVVDFKSIDDLLAKLDEDIRQSP